MSEFADRIVGPPDGHGLDRGAHQDAYEELARIHAELSEWLVAVAEEVACSPSPDITLITMVATLDRVCAILDMPGPSALAETISALRTEARRRERAAESMELYSQ